MSASSRETAEQAQTRRRWITLAEFVAVAGLLIGALTLYLNWSDREQDRAEKARETATEASAKSIVTLVGTVTGGGRSIALADAAHQISDAQVRFPAALKVAPRDAMPGPSIEAAWFADALLALTDAGSDSTEGRLPVLVTTRWWDGDIQRSGVARYDILWRTHGRVLQGRKLELTGFTLADRDGSVAGLEKAWARERPRG